MPRSTHAHLLVRDGRVEMVVDSPGGGRIPPAVVYPPLSLYFGGVHLSQRRAGGGWLRAADPRRDGEVRGHE